MLWPNRSSVFTSQQADYIDVAVQGPFKADQYRY